ncbi:MAG: EAL domain-containing protein, partial [Acidobacteria bacterium]|nr:EAL domain-containing protein [Acidobacteriota bacterium]
MRTQLDEVCALDGFGDSISVGVSEDEIDSAINQIALTKARSAIPALAAYFLTTAVFFEMKIVSSGQPEMQIAAAVAAAVLVAIAAFVGHKAVAPRMANLMLAASATVAVLYIFFQLWLSGRPEFTIYLIMLILGLASTILSWAYFFTIVATVLVGWGAVVWLVVPSSEWPLAQVVGIGILVGAVSGVVVQWLRLRAYRSRLLDQIATEKYRNAFQEVRRRYESAVSGANDGFWYWDLKSDTLAVSRRWLEILHDTSGALTRRSDSWFEAVDPYYRAGLEAAISSHLLGEKAQIEYKYRLCRTNGEHAWVLTRGLASRDSRGEATCIAGSMTDITHVIEIEQRVVQDALQDKLTGLANQHYLMTQLQAVMQANADRQESVAVVFIDLDDFKAINDCLGHPVGDQVLAEVASRLRQCSRSGDTVARYGGDEFVLVLRNLRTGFNIEEICGRIQQSLQQPLCVDKCELELSTSIGVCVGQVGVDDHEDLIRNADLAMYAAKTAGKGQFSIYTNETSQKTIPSWTMRNHVKNVVDREAYWLEYQPILCGETGLVVGAEALFRFDSGMDNPPSVEQFIRVAEETGFIGQIGAWVLKEACSAAARWGQAGLPAVPVSVNISAKQIVQADFAKTVREAWRAAELEPHRLELEITETALSTNMQLAKDGLNDIVASGVRLAIDDFGTGYSSLNHLGDFPLSTVKMDQSFVAGLEHNSKARALASGIISLVHGLRMEVTAEGVENSQQLACLASMGCDKIQGYLASRPLAACGGSPTLKQESINLFYG